MKSFDYIKYVMSEKDAEEYTVWIVEMHVIGCVI